MCRFIQYIVLYASFCAPYYPKTDLNISNETVKQDAAKIALERLRDKIDKILKDKKYEGLFI